MKNDHLKYFKPQVLIIIATLFALIIIGAKERWQISIGLISTLTLSLILIATYLWNYKPFSWLFWVNDFSGRYEGKLEYQYRDEKGNLNIGQLDHVKIINQNGLRIIVSSFTIKSDGSKSSLSISKGMLVEKTSDDNHYRLIYSYLNEGSTTQGFPPHYGSEVIKFIKTENDKILSGGYYTGREPYQTKGKFINLNWVSNNLNHQF